MHREDIIVCPDKTMMVKRMYDIDEKIVNGPKKNQIVELVLDSSLTN